VNQKCSETLSRKRDHELFFEASQKSLHSFLPVMIVDSNICAQLTTDFPFTNLPYTSFLVMLTVSLKQEEADMYTPNPPQTHTCIYMYACTLTHTHMSVQIEILSTAP